MKNKIVVKLGGASLQNSNILQELVCLVSQFRQKNLDVILVHGGGPAINKELTKRGIQWEFINGQRRTTVEMIDVIEQVLADEINPLLVKTLIEGGVPAVGLSGARDKILYCSRLSEQLDQVGSVQNVFTAAIDQAVSQSENPVVVVAPVGFGEGSEKYNINADWAAVKIALAVRAEQLIFLTDQNGILDHDKNLIPIATPALIQQLIVSGVISGGMYTKVMTMLAALSSGVQWVRVLNANVASQLVDNASMGTLLLDENRRMSFDGRY